MSGNNQYHVVFFEMIKLGIRSRGTTKRRYFRVAGDRTLVSVATANKIARRVAYLLEYHFAKNCHYVLENPLSSLLWKFRCIHRCLQRHGAKRVVVYLGAYGAHTLKPVSLSGDEHDTMYS